METLEDRLRAMEIHRMDINGIEPTNTIRLDAALAIVADAPRIYRGEEILDAPEGRYATVFDPVDPDPDDPTEWRNVYAKHYCVTHVKTMTDESGGWVFFGPLPTNSPSEGKKKTPLPPGVDKFGEPISPYAPRRSEGKG